MRPGVLSFFFLLAHTLTREQAAGQQGAQGLCWNAFRKELDMILLALSNKPLDKPLYWAVLDQWVRFCASGQVMNLDHRTA